MVGIDELKTLKIFNEFSEKQLEELAKITEKKWYESGSKVYQNGDRAYRLFVVTKGTISLSALISEDQGRIAFEIRECGGLFGCACLMKPRINTLTAVCLEDSEVLVIDADQLIELLEQDPQLGYKFMKKISQIFFERYNVAKREIHAMAKNRPLEKLFQ